MGPALRIAVALALLVGAAVLAVPALVPDAQPVAPPEAEAAVQIERSPDGSVHHVTTQPGLPSGLEADDAVAQLAPPESELVEIATSPRLAGGTAVRYQQEIGGIPVLGGEATIQLDPDGEVVSSLADLSTAPSPPTEATVAPGAAARQARQAAARDTGVAAADLRASPPERWLYDPAVLGSPSPLGVRLTWRTEVTDASGSVRQLVLVDAASGDIALSFSQVGHGRERQVCDRANVAQVSAACTPPFNRSEGQGPSGIADVDRAYTHAGTTYDWFHDRFGLDSLDGDGMPIRATVRFCRPTEPCPLTNSFWTGQEAVFGAGYPVDDVVAHELTHGVIEFSAHLFFWYQSGAINESMADVFGELIDLTDGTGNDAPGVRWRIGEELPGGALRSMSNPPTFGDPDRMSSPLFTTTQDDSGGVHTNSGVANKAASLLVDGGRFNGRTVTALGIDAVAAIWYEALTTVLTSASDYADLGVGALPQACQNVIGVAGIDAADCNEVVDAVAATEMAVAPVGAAPPEAAQCTAGQVKEDLFVDDFENPGAGNWRTSTAAGWAWSYPPPLFGRHATSGIRNLWGPDTGTPQSAPTRPADHGDARIRMVPAVTLPPGSFLHFRHAWGFESAGSTHRDGGVVEISADEGPWTDLGPRFTTNGYTGTLTGVGTNPLAGREAFVGDSRGYTSSRADLSSMAGQEVRIRFRVGEDKAGGDVGWYIDDFRLATCRAPGLHVTQVVDEDVITLGDPVHLHITVGNDGAAALNGVSIDAPEAPACEENLAQLSAGEEVTVDCTAVPDQAGPWTSVVQVEANQGPPATSPPVEVTVLAPNSPRIAVTQVADEDLVAVGEPIHLHLTVRNTGNVTLTGIDIADPTAPDCEKPVPSLPPGGSATVHCTVTPTAPGTFTTTASVSATEVPNAVDSEPVQVEVLDLEGPAVTITTPADGQVINQGKHVVADYGCVDDTELESCTGPVADGAPVNTSTVGDHPFTVVGIDGSGNRTEVTHTYTVARRRPDGRLRLGSGATVGDNVYNTNGAGQGRSGSAPRGGTVNFYATIQNDGSEPEQVRVRGQSSNASFTIVYRSGGVNITNQVVAGTWKTPVLAPGQVRTVRIQVTVRSSAPRGARLLRTITTASTANPSVKDVVTFTTSRS